MRCRQIVNYPNWLSQSISLGISVCLIHTKSTGPSMEHSTLRAITSILVAALLASPSSHLREVPVHHPPRTGGDGEAMSTQGFVSLARKSLLTPPSPTSNMSPPGAPSR